ncbi:MAG: AI-2E family transporter [Desulfuromonadales bacterium]|nr:AI-2E family transporter [Desulfuromonadales bacterium]
MTKKRAVTLSVIGVVFVVVCLFIYSLGSVFLPLFLALAIAFLMDPFVTGLAKWRLNRTLAIILVFSAASIFAIGILWFYTSSIKNEFASVQLNLPAYAAKIYERIPQSIKVYLNIETPEKVYQQINYLTDQLRGAYLSIIQGSFDFVKRAFSSTFSFILAILSYFIIPIYLYYLLLDFPAFKKEAAEFIPARYRANITDIVNEIRDVLEAFLKGQFSVCAILAILYSIGLYFIGIDLPVVIGTFAGFAFIIPYFGTILGIILSMSMAFLKFQDIWHPLLCFGWISFVQILESTVITPKIVGNRVGLHPVIIILSLLLAGELFGLMGMLLAIPVTAALKVLFKRGFKFYKNSKFYLESE